jgi:hypothetical protein
MTSRAQRCLHALVATILLVGLPAAAAGQNAAVTLRIETRDTSGAPVPGVVISLLNQQTGIERWTKTEADGSRDIVLSAGFYTVNGVLAGFKTAIIRDIRVQGAARAAITVVMTPGEYTEQVAVTADATTVRIGNSTVGAVFEAETLETLPVPEREALEFAVQAPGMATPAPGSRLSTQGNTGVNSSGAREASNNFLLDGADNNDQFLNRLVINPSLDAIEEVTLLQNTYNAQYGRSGGAQVNMVLKSGTRTLRGSAYEFFRHSSLSARNTFQPATEDKPLLQRHQFGGTLGGPLALARSFFFVNVEGVNGREADTRLARVPTAAERSGDFSANPATIRDPFTGAGFPGNRIPSARQSAAGLAALGLYPLPNRADPVANFVSSPIADRRAIQVTGKTDHTMAPGTTAGIRYSFSRDDRDTPFPVRARNLPGFGISVLDQGQNFAFGLTQAGSARMFHELRVGVNGLRRENLPQSAGVDHFSRLGITGPAIGETDLGYPTLVVSGYETLGDDANLPVVRQTRTIHVSDVLGFDLNRHHLKVGGEFRDYRSDGFNHLFARGQATFAGALTGNPVADLVLGLPSITLLGVNDNPQKLRTRAVNLFLQDDWRVTPRVTLNAGLRYEYNEPPYDADNQMRIFNLETLQLQQVGTNGVSRSGLQRDLNNFAPRAGLSWDIAGDGRMLLRAGYGIFYDSGTLIENSALYFNPPHFTLQLFFPGAQPLRLENPFPSGRGFSPRTSVNTVDPSARTAYTQQGSLALERNFRGTSTAVRYVTSYGDNMVRKRNINQPPPGPGPIDARRPIAGFGDILLVEPMASSTYHALQVSAIRRTSRRLSFRGAYTFANSQDDTSAFLATDGDDNTPQDSRNFAAEWGPSDYNVRHRMVLSGAYDLPGLSRWTALHNWQVAGVLTAQSGRPFTPRVSFDNSNTGNVGGGTFAYDRPNVVPAGTAGSVTYDGRAFAIAPQFTFGNAGRNSLTGPALVTLDVMAARRISLGSRRLLTLRIEGFNVLNRTNLGLPDSFVDRATFGRSLSAHPARQLQFAARFNF